jgi:integral membrane sensor domain MASE1
MDAFDIPIIGPLLLAIVIARCAALLKTYSRQRAAGASPRWAAGC